MAGTSWRGDPAGTRRDAFDKLQERIALEEEAVRAFNTAAEEHHREESRLRRVKDRRLKELEAARAGSEAALKALLRVIPGAGNVVGDGFSRGDSVQAPGRVEVVEGDSDAV